MTDVLDEGSAERGPIASSMMDAAQKAVGNGDYAEAERLLRQVAAIQEATLGSHPDLATTLNNLAFVCERLNKFDEAEQGYRRAHAIAVASLIPGHPLIKTSLSNLVEFCEARGIPIWTPPAAPAEDDPLPDDVMAEPPVSEVEPDVVRAPAAAGRLPLRMMAAAAFVVGAIIVVLFARQGQGTTETPLAVAQVRPESATGPLPSPAASPTPKPAPSPPPSPAPSAPPSPAPSPPPTRGPGSVPSAVRESPATVAPNPRPEISKASVTVLKAQLCSALDRKGSPDWQCTAASGELQPGRYLFYTRLLTKADTAVEHRWLRGGRVHQVTRLRVTASPGNGYRTLSGTTISPDRAGEWKVELRTVDGTLLEQTSFVVR